MPDRHLDTSGLTCPIPILKAKKALAEMAGGMTLEIVATDPPRPRILWLSAKQPVICCLKAVPSVKATGSLSSEPVDTVLPGSRSSQKTGSQQQRSSRLFKYEDLLFP